MNTLSNQRYATSRFVTGSISLFLAVVVAFSVADQSVFADDSTVRGSDVSVVARSGGFPTLAPRAQESRNRALSSATESPSYRVVDASASRVDGSGSRFDEFADDSVTEELALLPTPESSRSKMMAPLVTVASSLAIVLALFSGLVWAGRKFGGRASAAKPLPAGALTPLGHVMLDPRTKLLLVKCGRRILVLSQTATGITPITEVTHPEEVHELIASCSADAREAFQRTLREVEREPARPSADPVPQVPSARQSGRLFATV